MSKLSKKKPRPPAVTLICSICGHLCEDNLGLPAEPLSSGRSCLRCGPDVRRANMEAQLQKMLSKSSGRSKPNPKTLAEPTTTDIGYLGKPTAPVLKTYFVKVYRTSYCSLTIEVQAENEEQAASLAEDEAGGHVFSEGNAEYEVESVREKVDDRLLKEYGKRCPRYTAHCVSCEAWRFYDKFGKCPTEEQIDIWMSALLPCDPEAEGIPWGNLSTN